MHTHTPRSTITRLLSILEKDRPIAEQIKAHFVPALSFFGKEGVVTKNSLHGRISCFIHQNVSQIAIHRKVRTIFAKALAELIQTKEGWSEIPISERISLLREFQSEEPIKSLRLYSEQAYKSETEELDSLKMEALQAREAADALEVEEIKIGSSLRIPSGNEPILELSVFQELFGFKGINTAAYQQRLESFLTKREDLAIPNWKVQSERIQEGISFRDALLGSAMEENQLKHEEARLKILRKAAKKLEGEFSRFQTDQGRLLCGTFGPRAVSLEKIFSVISTLPESVKDKAPEAVRNLAEKLSMKPEDFVDQTVHEWVEKIKGQVQAQNDQGQLDFLNALLPDESRKVSQPLATVLPESVVKMIEARLQKGLSGNVADLLNGLLQDKSRKLPEALSRWLPNVIQHGIENRMQGGFLEILAGLAKFSPSSQVSDFLSVILLNKDLIETEKTSATLNLVGKLFWLLSYLPAEGSVKILQWVAENAHLLKEAKSRHEVEKRLELEISNWVKKPLKRTLEEINDVTSNVVNQLRSSIQPEFFKLLGLDGTFPFGHLWLECYRQPNGLFRVTIYSTGLALTKHPENEQGKIRFPYVLTDIEPAKFNRHFFFKFLFHMLEPSCNTQVRSSGEELFEFIVEHLNGKEDLLKQPIYRAVSPNMHHEMELMELCLTKETVPQGYPNFLILFDALKDFCLPYLTGKEKTLEIFDASIASALEGAIEKLANQKELLQPFLPSDFCKSFEVTRKEIERAVRQFKIRTALQEGVKGKTELTEGINLLQLPKEFLTPIREYFLHYEICEETILSYKSTLMWALGDEIGEFIDALAATVGSIDKPKKHVENPAMKHVKNVLKRGWLREVIHGICFQSALSVLKFTISAARIYQTGVPPLFILSSVDWAARQILPKVVLDWYYSALGYILKKSIEMTLKVALRLILNPQEINQFLELKNNWKRLLHETTKQVMGIQELKYELSQPFLQQLPLEPLGIAIDSQTADQPLNLVSSSKNIDQPPVQVRIPPPTNLVDPLILQEEVTDWIETSKLLERQSIKDAFYYLCTEIERLKIPLDRDDSFWKAVNNRSKTLEALYSLSMRLLAIARVINDSCKLFEDRYGLAIVSFYSILSIVDCLVKQDPQSPLKEYRINIYELLVWCSSETGFLTQSSSQSRLKQVLSYFGINSYFLPENQKSLENAKDCLFYYDGDSFDDWGLLKKESKEFVLFKQHLPNIDFLTMLPQNVFSFEMFLKIIEDPVQHSQKWDLFVGELWRRGLKSNLKFLYPHRYQKGLRIRLKSESPKKCISGKLLEVFKTPNWQNNYADLSRLVDGMFVTNEISDLEKCEILFAESFAFRNHFQSKLFPDGFIYLRFQSLLSSLFVKRRLFVKKNTEALEFELEHSRLYFRSENNLEKRLTKLFKIWQKKVPTEILSSLSAGYYPSTALHSEFYLRDPYRQTQSEIIEINALKKALGSRGGVGSNSDDYPNDAYYRDLATQGPLDWPTIEQILCEPKDACARLLSYFTEHKDSLINHPRLFEFFERVMFRPFAIAEQIGQSPVVVHAFGEFILSQLRYHEAHNNLLVRYWLITVGIKLRDVCRAFNLPIDTSFPSFKEELKKLQPMMATVEARMFYHMAGALTEVKSLSELDAEEQLSFALDLVLPLFSGSQTERQEEFIRALKIIRDSHARFLESTVEAYKIRYWQEYEMLVKLLDDSSFANRLIKKMLEQLHIAFRFDQNEWKLTAELIYSNGTTSIDFKNGAIRSNHPLVSIELIDKVNDLRENVLKLPESDRLIQNHEGNFRSLDGTLSVNVLSFSKVSNKEIYFSGHYYRCVDLSRYRFRRELEEGLPQHVLGNYELWIKTDTRMPSQTDLRAACIFFRDQFKWFWHYRGNDELDALTEAKLKWKEGNIHGRDLAFLDHEELNALREFQAKYVNEEFSQLSFSVNFKATKQIGHTLYHFFPQEKLLLTPEFYSSLGLEHTSRDQFAIWIEETASPKRKIYISPHAITKELSQPLLGLLRLPAQKTPDFGLLELPDHLEVSQIKALERFCPRSKTQVFSRSGSSKIERLVFKPFNLAFDVISEGGNFKAVNPQHFPGYYIAPKQYRHDLNCFGNYLLLINEEGRQKVLIPDGQWLSTLALRVGALLGPLASFLVGKIDQKAIESKHKYYTFDMTESGELITEDPEALLFLIGLSLAANRYKDANRLCNSFELIAKRVQLSRTLIQPLLPLLLVPADINGSVSIRKRLIVAFEENFALNATSKPEKRSGLFFAEGVSCLIVLYDLLQSLQKNRVTSEVEDFQDWFLFQYVFRLLGEHLTLLMNSVYSPAEDEFCKNLNRDFAKYLSGFLSLMRAPVDIIKNLADRFSLEMIIETVILPKELGRRLSHLRKRFGKDETLAKKAVQFVFDVLRTPSGISPLGLQFQQVIPKIEGESSIQMGGLLNVGLIARDAAQIFFGGAQRLDFESLFDQMKTSKDGILTDEDFDSTKLTAVTFKQNFFNYYKIARHFGKSAQTKKLRQLLPFIHGCFDHETSTLVNYLSYVVDAKYFLMFKTSEDFSKAFTLDISKDVNAPFEEKYPKWIPFFTHLDRTVKMIETTKKGVDLAIPAFLDRFMHNRILRQLNPGKGSYNHQFPLLSLGVSAFHTLKSYYDDRALFNKAKVEGSLLPAQRSLFVSVQEDDEKFDEFLRNHLFSSAFELGPVIEHPDEEVTVAAFELYPNLDQEVGETTVKRINLSIQDYYSREGRTPKEIRVKSEEALWGMYVQILEYYNGLKSSLQAERKKLLDIVNEGNAQDVISFEELCQAFLQGDFNHLLNRLQLAANLVSKLDAAIARDLARHTRLQQLERILEHFNSIASIKKESLECFEDRIEMIAEELLTERAYRFDQESSRLVRRLMLFEYVTKKMVWKKQFASIKQLLLGQDVNAVIELLMSLGKTYFCIPMINAFEADQTKIVFNIFPSAIAETNIRQIGSQARAIFNQTANVLRFNRAHALTHWNLETISMVLQRSMKQGETINMTREDIQALELMFLDELYRLRKANTLRTYERERRLVEIANILQSIRRFGKVIGDEAHEIFNRRQELNYPVGPHSTIRQSYYMVMEMCMRHLMRIPKIRERLYENNLSKLSPEEYQDEVRGYLAHKMSEYKPFAFVTDQERNEFIAYVSGQTLVIPEALKRHALFSEIALVKGVLGVLLPLTFSRTVNVDFGASLQGNGEYARPYEGNTSPMEQASIRSPFEAFVKTFIQFLHTGLTQAQLDLLIKTLLKKMHQEMKVRKVSAKDTRAYKLFETWSPEVSLSDVEASAERRNSLQPAVFRSTEAILLYIRYHVQGEIKYWKYNLRSGPQDFASMFASGFFDTGTPYNFGTYPSELKMLWDPGTIGEALHIINKKCPENGIHVLKSSMPKDVLHEVLHKFFSEGSLFTALIDGSALLKGLENDEVAKEIMEFISSSRRDLKGIVYFRKDKQGRDQLVCLEKGMTQPIAFDRSSLKPEERLSYFDQRHGFAADIPQMNNAIGLNLVGTTLTLNRLMQEVFRMRGIKKWKKIRFSNSFEAKECKVSGTQSIQFAMTEETRALISQGETPSLRDIVQFAIRNEANMAAEDNYESYKQKVISVVRRAILDKLEQCESTQKMVELFDEFQHVLVQHVQDDPASLFGYIDIEKETEGEGGVLEQLRASAYGIIGNSLSFTRSEKEAIKLKLEGIEVHTVPSKVKVQTDNGKLILNAGEDLNKEVQHEVSKESEEEQENNRENELQNFVQAQFSGLAFQEWSWTGEFNPHETSWIACLRAHGRASQYLKLQARGGLNFIKRLVGAKTFEPTIPPLFKLQALIGNSDVKILAETAQHFDSRLWVSNNFLPRHFADLSGDPVEIGAVTQRDLHEVIVHFKEGLEGKLEFLSMGCLSIKDSVELRERLQRSRPTETKAFIYDINLRTIVSGYQLNLESLRKDPDFILLEGQVKFLNGDVVYHRDQLRVLKKWMRRCGATKLKEAFAYIHSSRGRREFAGSDMEQMILAAQNIPKEERF